jgi:hypothetical protein
MLKTLHGAGESCRPAFDRFRTAGLPDFASIHGEVLAATVAFNFPDLSID